MSDTIRIYHLNVEVEGASDIRWGNEDKSSILCTLQLSDGTTMPFHAFGNDSEEHGVLLFKHLSEGVYGKVAKFKPRKQETIVADPLEKLKNFLAANPDVAALLKGESA